MRIWIDILTPKQVLFFQPLIERLEKKNHEVLITSRRYREAEGLLKLRGLYEQTFIIGKHGGGDKLDKLNAHLNRCKELTKFAVSMQPDLCISFCSPEAAKVTFGLGITHYGYCNASHSDKVLRLTLPLIQKLLCPDHIPIEDYIQYGITSDNIIRYHAYDEFVLIKNDRPTNFKPRKFSRPIILVRGSESQASYGMRQFDIFKLIENIHNIIPSHQVVVIPRYKGEVQYMKNRLGKSAYVYDRIVDSKTVLENCDLFVGSGGTMTSEAVLRGVPAISLNIVPNRDEEWLVNNHYLVRADTIPAALFHIRKMIQHNDWIKKDRYEKGLKLTMGFEDPHSKLFSLRLIK